jgi:hypothetical protein
VGFSPPIYTITPISSTIAGFPGNPSLSNLLNLSICIEKCNVKKRLEKVMEMDGNNDRRREKRLSYYWPIWFAEDFNGTLSQGQMADVSSKAAAFTCYPDSCPFLGQQLTVRFSVPRYGPDDSFDLANFTCEGQVSRVDDVSRFSRRIALKFTKPLPFRPGEQDDSDSELQPAGQLDAMQA